MPLQGSVNIVSSNGQASVHAVYDDDQGLALGDNSDAVLYLRSTALAADTALTDVLEGTVESQGVAANSLLISDITDDGDVAIYVSKGGNSQMAFWADGSTGDTAIMAASGQSVDVYIAGTKEIDYSTGALAFQQATTISATTGDLTLSSASAVKVGVPLTVGVDDTGHDVQFFGATAGSHLLWDESANALTLAGSACGIGISPDAEARLHLWDSTAGSISASADTILALESSNANARIEFMSPTDADNVSITWTDNGSPGAHRGRVRYNHDADSMSFYTANTARVSIDSSGIDMLNHPVLNVGAAGNDLSANLWTMSSSASGVRLALKIENTNTDASSLASLETVVPASANAAVDASTTWTVKDVMAWCAGVDNDQSDRFAITNSATLGTGDALRVAAGGTHAITFDDSTSVSAGDFDYVCDRCGRSALDLFECCGQVSWHDDVLALRQMRLNPAGLAQMVKLGVYEIDGPDDADPGWMGFNLQRAMHFTWAGMWQNRQRMDSQYEELSLRLARLETA